MVLVKDDCLPRNEWLLARVIETYTSEDSKVRNVKLSQGDKNLDVCGMRKYCKRYLERPIHKLVLLIEFEYIDPKNQLLNKKIKGVNITYDLLNQALTLISEDVTVRESGYLS